MQAARMLRAQAYNNAWANHRLLKACGTLPAEALLERRTSFFPSIVHTLNHILTVDWFYVSALEGACIGPSAWNPEIPFEAIEDIEREQRAADRRLITVCDGLDEAGLERPVHVVRDTGTEVDTMERVLLHLFQHDIHHRGQVHAMLAGTDAAPPQLDEFFLDRPDDRTLRARDFDELGFSEQAIWG